MASYSATGSGLASGYNSFEAKGAGLASGYNSFEARGAGLASGYNPFGAAGTGLYSRLLACVAEGLGLHRAANDALDRYELYRGQDGDPDFSTPWETFTALPHETAALAVDHDYSFVLRCRNRWNLVSQNVRAWAVRIAADGSAEPVPPAGPDWVNLAAVAGGTVRVRAAYAYERDGDYAADSWLIYLTSDGSNPDPDIDTPTVVSMRKTGGAAALDWTSGAFADGATIKVLLRTRRTAAPNVDSENTGIETVEANTDGPAAIDPLRARFGNLREQAP